MPFLLFFQLIILIDSFLRHARPHHIRMPQGIDQRQLIMVGIERIASSFVPIRFTLPILKVLSLGIAHGRYRRIQLAFLLRNPKDFFEGFFLNTVIEVA